MKTTIEIPDRIWEKIKELIEEGEYVTISEALRDLIKKGLDALRKEKIWRTRIQE